MSVAAARRMNERKEGAHGGTMGSPVLFQRSKVRVLHGPCLGKEGAAPERWARPPARTAREGAPPPSDDPFAEVDALARRRARAAPRKPES
jgi:hypothetical protein